MKIPKKIIARLEQNYEFHEIEPEPMLDKVRTSINNLKKEKSTGYDDIPEELIQAGVEAIVQVYHKLCVKIWNRTLWP
jgi:hypothetical protein